MDQGSLGREYEDGAIIVRQGDTADSMFVIQQGQVEVLSGDADNQVRLRIAREGEFLGEMAIFERIDRSATLRAMGPVRLLTIDKKNLLRRIHEDPSLAFRIVKTMSGRIRELSDEVARLKNESGS